jgi:uncharacterized protein YjbI with pentapeptide repeats
MTLRKLTREQVEKILIKSWKVDKRAALSQADLSNVNLSGMHLNGADLSGTNLSRANLTKANLINMIFNGTDLSGADLTGADLLGADLTKVDLTGANLSRANLSRANLSKKSLSGTNLSGTNLSEANLTETNLTGSDLSEANLIGANLSGANLSRANLIGANLSGADLREIDLTEVTLSGANLSKANLFRVNLSEIDLSQADLSQADLGQTNLSRANLSKAILIGANLLGANLSGTNLSGANLSGANFGVPNVTELYLAVKAITTADPGMYITKTEFNQVAFGTEAPMRLAGGADLTGANLTGANLTLANLTEVDCTEAETKLDQTNFSNAILAETSFTKVDLSQAKGLTTVQHQGHSTIDINTIYQSKDKIPEVFLKGTGVHPDIIRWQHSLHTLPTVLLKELDLIDIWDDTQITVGTDWEQEIIQAIARSSVAILLVSANFLSSKVIKTVEIPQFLERHSKDENFVMYPIIIKPCPWQAVPWLKKIEVRPKGGKPIWGGDMNVEEQLAKIASEVIEVIKNRWRR